MSDIADKLPDGGGEGELPIGRIRVFVRIAVFVLLFVQAIAALGMVITAITGKTDAIGNDTMAGYATVACMAVVVFGGPALYFALNRKHLKTALIRSLIFPFGLLYMMSI